MNTTSAVIVGVVLLLALLAAAARIRRPRQPRRWRLDPVDRELRQLIRKEHDS